MKIARLLFRRRHFSLTRFLEPQGRRTSAAGSSSRHSQAGQVIQSFPVRQFATFNHRTASQGEHPACAGTSLLHSLCSKDETLAPTPGPNQLAGTESLQWRNHNDRPRITSGSCLSATCLPLHQIRGELHVSFQELLSGLAGEQVRGQRYFPIVISKSSMSINVNIAHTPSLNTGNLQRDVDPPSIPDG